MAEKDKGNTNDAININQLFENSLQNEVTSSTGDVTVEEDTSADSADEILLFVDQSQGQNVQTLLQAALQQGNITTTADGTTCIELKKVSEVASVDQSEVTRLHLPLLSGDNEIINQSQDHGYAALTSSSSDINAGNITFSSDTASTLTQFANLTGSLAHSKLEAPEKIPKFSSGSIKLNEFLSKGSTVKVGEQMKKARSGSSNDKLEFASNFQDPSNVAVTEPGKINVGDEFYCLEDIEHALRQYEITHNVKLYKRDVRSIEALMKRSLKLQKLDQINMKLRYGQLLFCCVYGGKRKAQKLACVDESGVARYTDCKMFIRFGISSDGMKLVVNGMSEEHCHAEVVTEEQEQPVIVTNEGNAEELCLGAGFVDIDELYKAVHKYETDHHIHLWRRDGRTVEALARRAPGTAKKIMEANPGLRFAELRFCCSFGGGRQGDSKEKDHKSPK